MIKFNKNEVWQWYLRLEESIALGLSGPKYCQLHKLSYQRFCNMRYRIIYKRNCDPILYKKLLALGRAFPESELSKKEYANKHAISLLNLSESITHIGYLDIIEEMKAIHGNKPMTFIEVPSVPAVTQAPQEIMEPELLKKQNDVELIISSGVKVVVAPEVGADKLIRIIELLKDL